MSKKVFVRYNGPNDYFIWTAGDKELHRGQAVEIENDPEAIEELLTYPDHDFELVEPFQVYFEDRRVEETHYRPINSGVQDAVDAGEQATDDEGASDVEAFGAASAAEGN